MSKLLPQVLHPRLFTYTADEEVQTIEAHLCVPYPVSERYMSLYFYEIINGNLVVLKVVTHATEVDGGVRL